METLTSPTEKNAEQLYIDKVVQTLPPLPDADDVGFSKRIHDYL